MNHHQSQSRQQKLKESFQGVGITAPHTPSLFQLEDLDKLPEILQSVIDGSYRNYKENDPLRKELDFSNLIKANLESYLHKAGNANELKERAQNIKQQLEASGAILDQKNKHFYWNIARVIHTRTSDENFENIKNLIGGHGIHRIETSLIPTVNQP